MEKIYILFLLLFSPTLTKAQQPIGIWKNYFTNPSLVVSYKEVLYPVPGTDIVKAMLVFRIENKTADNIQVSLTEELHYGSNCLNCDGKTRELNPVFNLASHEILEGDCSKTGASGSGGLKIFKQFVSPAVAQAKTAPLSQFKLNRIQVSLIK